MTAALKPEIQTEDDPRDIGEAIELAILEFTETGQLSPRAQIAFEGHSFQLDVVRVPEPDGAQMSGPVLRNIRTAPLESSDRSPPRRLQEGRDPPFEFCSCRASVANAIGPTMPLFWSGGEHDAAPFYANDLRERRTSYRRRWGGLRAQGGRGFGESVR